MNFGDFKPGMKVKIVSLDGWSFPDRPDELLGKFGTVVDGLTSNTYVDVRVDGLEGTYYERYADGTILFLPEEIEAV